MLCLCGNPSMPGAATLTVRAAARAGAGLVTLGVFSHEIIAPVSAGSPETVFLDLSRTKELFASRLPHELVQHRHGARVAGPGLGQSGQTRELVRCLVGSIFAGPLVLDADALNVLAGGLEAAQEYKGALILTPHPGEAARLNEEDCPADDAGRLTFAREIAERSGSICVLKGHRTVVTDGERDYVNETGSAGMATAGSGDVLAGVLGAYLSIAEDEGPWDVFGATCAAVYVHGLAGELATERHGVRGAIASDQIAALPEAHLRHMKSKAKRG